MSVRMVVSWAFARALRSFAGAVLVAGALAPAWAIDAPPEPADALAEALEREGALERYRELAADQARNYDTTQDISVRQMLLLLEVAERTGTSLGRALATGEFESAQTWNDFVRPTLGDGHLGSASGVWQFIPSTFHRVIQRFGAEILALSEADQDSGRGHLDLSDGPFSDEQVRELIRETVEGRRGVQDDELQLLRHNFAVLAFAKHFLSVESGAVTPEEDYLFHFLGAERGRQVLALARGAARGTLCVQRSVPLDGGSRLAGGVGSPGSLDAQPSSSTSNDYLLLPRTGASPQIGISARYGLSSGLQRQGLNSRRQPLRDSAVYKPSSRPLGAHSSLSATSASARPVQRPAVARPSMVSSQWGLPADSPVVTGNLGMFYRDGSGQSQPYTWGEFMERLGQRVRSKDQPALVRAKYGVGFSLNEGDMPVWRFDPESPGEPTRFEHEIGGSVTVPHELVLGPLAHDEMQQFKARLSELAARGDDQPIAVLPHDSVVALRHLGALADAPFVEGEADAASRAALERFRRMVGKETPDDPAYAGMLLPVERVALELYDQRLARYAVLQAGQDAAMADALDLNGIREMPEGAKRRSIPHVAVMQRALAEADMLAAPTRRVVWRDRSGKRRARYEPARHDGLFGPMTLGALNRFQLSQGLRATDGRLDAVTVGMLGLPPMGDEIFLPMSGPQCEIAAAEAAGPQCLGPGAAAPFAPLDALILDHQELSPRWRTIVLAAAEPDPADRLLGIVPD